MDPSETSRTTKQMKEDEWRIEEGAIAQSEGKGRDTTDLAVPVLLCLQRCRETQNDTVCVVRRYGNGS